MLNIVCYVAGGILKKCFTDNVGYEHGIYHDNPWQETWQMTIGEELWSSGLEKAQLFE